MQVFKEWIDSRIKMTFQEKYNILLQRLSTLQNMKISADNAIKNKNLPTPCGWSVCGEERSVDEIISDVDAMWNEIKKDISKSVKK